MIACRACGHTGPTQGIDDGRFFLSVCGACGFGLGISAGTRDETGSLIGQVNVPSGPQTTAYELSPTGPQKVVEDEPAISEPDAPEEPTPIVAPPRGGTLLMYSENEALDAALAEWSTHNAHYQLERAESGQAMIGQVVKKIQGGDDRLLYLLDDRHASFPATELGFAIRAIEAAFDVARTPMTILCESQHSNEETFRRLGDTQTITVDDEQTPTEQVIQHLENRT